MSRFKTLFASFAAAAALTAQAAPITFIGADNSVSSLAQMTNSAAAAAAFTAATGASIVVNFESPLPAGISIAGGSITDDSGCGALCGFNTTAGGSMFLNLFGGSTTISFANGIDAFGLFITGLQTNIVPPQSLVLTYAGGATETISFPSAILGGGAFIGVLDAGASILSATFNVTNDIVSFDDIRLRAAVNRVPEPGSLALLAIGVLALAAARRRRR